MAEIVIFVCNDNAVLGPMARMFLRRHCRSIFKVYSAGIEPKPIHLLTLQVMEEIGYDFYDASAKSIFDLNHLQWVDYLITLTEYVNQNFIFNDNNIGRRLHWPFNNPLVAQEQFGLFLSDEQTHLSSNNHETTLEEQVHLPDGILLRTKSKTNLHIPVVRTLPTDQAEIRKRFRRVRDEIEVQVMNWMEEKGIGPLWWRGS